MTSEETEGDVGTIRRDGGAAHAVRAPPRALDPSCGEHPAETLVDLLPNRGAGLRATAIGRGGEGRETVSGT
ncbi:MAG: hypothetical protein DME06_07045 [Candidatus Rokuibacteriota bacterium]|nr:MAG: hypothetical protein DME06_07045 [Candidatus Rokubacteria bacterium]